VYCRLNAKYENAKILLLSGAATGFQPGGARFLGTKNSGAKRDILRA